VRRRAQLAWLRPDLVFAELRGNIATRLDRARDHDAIVVAAAAIDRLGLDRIPVDRISPTVMVPQVAQGAVVVECRSDDRATRTALAAIDDPDTRRAVDAERAFLAELGGDCDLPAGAHAITVGEPAADGAVPPIELLAMLSSLDGRVLIREQRRGADPVALGRSVARHLLDDAGGASLLAAVR
jgi:hydroxymethylbilane synthase